MKKKNNQRGPGNYEHSEILEKISRESHLHGKKKNGSRIKEYKDEGINTEDDREKVIGWSDQEKQKPYSGGHDWPTWRTIELIVWVGQSKWKCKYRLSYTGSD